LSVVGDPVMERVKDNHGFTLVELVMVIVVLSVLATMFASLFGLAVKGYDVMDTRADLIFTAGASLAEMAGCVRRARWIEGELPLSAATEITVMCDIDEDDVLERVHYYYIAAEKELRRKIDNAPAGGVLLAEGVEVVSFSGGPELVTSTLELSGGDEQIEMRTSAGGQW
jgi:prepilin-type N-terminal cleavage/methylation domain-containing protein